MSRSATTGPAPTQRADNRERDQPRAPSDGWPPDRDREREERRAQRMAARGRRSPDEPIALEPVVRHRPPSERDEWPQPTKLPAERGHPGRQTVTITGRGAEAYATRRGTRPSSAQRHQAIRRHEREDFRPDRVAMWAVMLGVMLMLAAAASSHAALLAHHLPVH